MKLLECLDWEQVWVCHHCSPGKPSNSNSEFYSANLKSNWELPANKFKTAFTRSWSGSNDIENIEKFFSVEHGSIVTTEAICLTNQVDIATYSKKKFVEPFVNAVKALHLVSDKDENMRILEFKRFINEFGTHYASTSEMGTKLSIGTWILRWVLDQCLK